MSKTKPKKSAGKEYKCAEREVAIGHAKYHVKSVFIGQTSLGEALKNIIARRLKSSGAA